MSYYASISGNGVATQADLRQLRRVLMRRQNEILERFPQVAKERKDQPAHSRTTHFEFFYPNGREYDSCGSVSIDIKGGTFDFTTDYNNRTLEDAAKSPVYQALMYFIEHMPQRGTRYGAETYTRTEYDEDEYGHRGPGHTHRYGAWALERVVCRRPSRR